MAKKVCGVLILLAQARLLPAQESPYLYGIHDHDTTVQQWFDHLNAKGVTGWSTATLAVGHNPSDYSGGNFTNLSNQGHTVIGRLNNGYYSDGTIPPPSQYANFAQRCANYVAASQGCNIWIIGNETNLWVEWPAVNGYFSYVSPQDYANCFRQCYNAIKAVRPGAKVICQALAPWGGPYGGDTNHDAMPLSWTGYMYDMLTAIQASGGIDGIAVHIGSRGYTYADVHSTTQVNGQYWSFYAYKDWVNLGTPASMRTLPYYATECTGLYYWKGGHAECTNTSNPSCSYQSGWLGWILEEINAWNQAHASTGEGIIRCVNLYRWCAYCDDWNIDGSPVKSQIMADLDTVAALKYRWDNLPPPIASFIGSPTWGTAPLAVTFSDQSTGTIDNRLWDFGDGSTSTAINPTHIYLAAGAYTVKLTATGPGGSNTASRPNYITVSAPPAGSNLIINPNFDANLNGWTIWIERNSTGDFSATVSSGELLTRGTNYNGGIWQQFGTGGAGTRIDISGTWRSSPTIASYQWAEVRIINGPRTPMNGTDEGAQSDSILIYKNDTWTTPAGWNDFMTFTAPVANVGYFLAADNLATLVLKSGNTGGSLSGIGWDNLLVRTPPGNHNPTAVIQANPTIGNIPLTVHFDGSGSSDQDGDSLTFAWNFGDGQTGSGAVVDHTFTTGNTYTVSLTVSDSHGGSDSKTVQIIANGSLQLQIIIESRTGGQNAAWYAESGVWGNSSLNSTASGVTTGIGSRYGSTYRSVAGLKYATFTPTISNGGWYNVYATWPTSSLARSPILYRITHSAGITELDVDQTINGNTWYNLGLFNFAAGTSGSVLISNEHIDTSGNMFASAVKFVRISDPLDFIIESRSGGQNNSRYTEEGTWSDTSATSSATGVTAALGSRYGSTYRSVAGLKRAIFTPSFNLGGTYRVYATWPVNAFARSPILYRIIHSAGTTELDVDQTANTNTWYNLGLFNFAAGTNGAVQMSNEHIDVSGNMLASAIRFVQTLPPPLSRADFDQDYDVDLDDFAHFQGCISGNGIGQTNPGCQDARLDDDVDVDAYDLNLFLSCMSGAGLPANVNCPE